MNLSLASLFPEQATSRRPGQEEAGILATPAAAALQRGIPSP